MKRLDHYLLTVFVKAIYAGLLIGLGGMAYLSCENKVIGSALFSVGLISILVFDLELYTGRVCYPQNKPEEWPLVMIGNIIGTTAMAVINQIDTTAIAYSKLNKGLWELFIDGVLCGISIAISVKGYRKTNNVIVPIIGVVTFITIGAEHCIADMFYLASTNAGMQLFIITLGNTVGGILCGFI